jgi:hypothetical protein
LHDKAGIVRLEVKMGKRFYLWTRCSRLLDIKKNRARERLIGDMLRIIAEIRA